MIRLQKEEIVDGQWFTFSDATQKIIYPEGKATLKSVQYILSQLRR